MTDDIEKRLGEVGAKIKSGERLTPEEEAFILDYLEKIMARVEKVFA